MNDKEKEEIQKEIVDSLKLKPTGRLLLAPRCGKTKIAIDIIKKNKPTSILWVTPSSELAKKDIPEEFNKWKAKKYLKILTTVTWASLNKITGYFDMIILDEEQKITENNCINFINKKINYDYLISMTGTPTKHEDKLQIYRNLKLNILYDISINKAVNIGLLSDYSIKILEVGMSNKKDIKAGNKNVSFMTSEIDQYRWLHINAQNSIFQKKKDAQFKILSRMRAIYNSKTKTEVAKYLMNTLKGRKLFFCSSIKQAELLCENTYHSKTDNKDLQKFISGEIDNISMVNAGGIGFTYKNIDHLVIVQADSNKNGLSCQKAARVLLRQKNYKATIWIISLLGTQDEKWVSSLIESFDKNKIEYVNYKNGIVKIKNQ